MPAPFRITRPPGLRRKFSLSPVGDSVGEYLGRLIKLIPSEVVGLYITGKGILVPPLGRWSTVCLALVLFVRILGTRDPAAQKGIQWLAVGVSGVSFVIWMYATGDRIWNCALNSPKLVTGAVLVWTFIVPYFYKGDPKP